jgi:hypothetical protein
MSDSNHHDLPTHEFATAYMDPELTIWIYAVSRLKGVRFANVKLALKHPKYWTVRDRLHLSVGETKELVELYATPKRESLLTNFAFGAVHLEHKSLVVAETACLKVPNLLGIEEISFNNEQVAEVTHRTFAYALYNLKGLAESEKYRSAYESDVKVMTESAQNRLRLFVRNDPDARADLFSVIYSIVSGSFRDVFLAHEIKNSFGNFIVPVVLERANLEAAEK